MGLIRGSHSFERQHCDEEIGKMLIIEVSVDNNGGEKEIGQAFDCSRLIERPNETVLLFTLNVDRSWAGGLKITQETFMYLHSSDKSERKILGFLWRDVYEAGGAIEFDFLMKSCGRIVRCLHCSEYLRTISSATNTNQPVPETKWDLISNNVAVDKYVFKIFVYRFHPMYRKPDVWLQHNHPWTAGRNVVKHLEFKESESLDVLGKPTKKRCREGDPPTNVARIGPRYQAQVCPWYPFCVKSQPLSRSRTVHYLDARGWYRPR